MLAAELAKKLRSNSQLNHYHYGNHPVREEVVRSIPGANGEELAVITRNIYGALVLNTANAMFGDVDFPEVAGGASLAGWWRRFIGKSPPIESQEPSLERLRSWAAQNSKFCIRVYRTRAGLRCLVTNRIFDAGNPDTITLLNGMGSDPLYIRLCQAQASFRARLTPKPWRCGSPRPPSRYPWSSGEQEAHYRRWQSDYERTIQRYSVCRLIEQIGSSEVHPQIKPIIAIHDQFTCGPAEHPLG